MEPFFDWAWRALLTAIVAGNFFWIKKWMKDRETWEKEHGTDHKKKDEEYLRAGGLVTRDKFFDFCDGIRAKCSLIPRVDGLCMWKGEIISKGGIMSKDEYRESEDKLATKLITGIRELFNEHNQIVDQRLGAIKGVIDANAKNLDLVVKRQGEVVTRIDQHLANHSKKE